MLPEVLSCFCPHCRWGWGLVAGNTTSRHQSELILGNTDKLKIGILPSSFPGLPDYLPALFFLLGSLCDDMVQSYFKNAVYHSSHCKNVVYHSSPTISMEFHFEVGVFAYCVYGYIPRPAT